MNTTPWQVVFTRWLKTHSALDRIDFVDVPRWPGQARAFEFTGPILTVTNP